MKRWFAILFLSFFALNFAGIYIYFAFRLVHIRHEMRATLKSLPEERLTKLELTEAEFKQSRVEDHEIKIGGRMYDVARTQAAGGKVTVWCLHDEAEDNLLAFLDAVSNRAHQDTKPVPQPIQQFLSLTFIVSEFHFVFVTTATSLQRAIQPLPEYTTELPVPSPPPQKAGAAFS